MLEVYIEDSGHCPAQQLMWVFLTLPQLCTQLIAHIYYFMDPTMIHCSPAESSHIKQCTGITVN